MPKVCRKVCSQRLTLDYAAGKNISNFSEPVFDIPNKLSLERVDIRIHFFTYPNIIILYCIIVTTHSKLFNLFFMLYNMIPKHGCGFTFRKE